ncbi:MULTISPECIES: DUF6895 family protein [unclassified Streptomyces]|uniref:DUF6895 family protein n=1 Tax=unclassified Streptomyces TaxID=2593676 RepID=UPI0022B72FE1|nr:MULTISPECIES: hypothetical protein [unclassified Streptomyces]MCZ7414904.1 hypothetical protein [Streptomyces sp. WMMC897]MCZ7431847.1 hypothetical protein [Streptomyces sp. WMMC1477]
MTAEAPARAVLRRALAWLDAHREAFRPPDDAGERATPDRVVKPLGELGQLMARVRRRTEPGSVEHARAGELLEFAWQAAGRGELFHTLALAEPHATYPLEMYAAFAATGRRHRGFEAFARFGAGTRAWRSTECQPTRALAVLEAERRLGLGPHTDPGAATAATWLGGLPEPWAFETRAGYAATHHVFHVTRWGEAPELLSADVRHYLAAWLPAWTRSCLEEESWDLAGELLAVAACLPEPSRDTDAAWRDYAAAQGPDGVVAPRGPAPTGTGEDVFLACYHPTLVAAFAAALTVDRRPAPLEAAVGGQP